jgi:hypothetical protein
MRRVSESTSSATYSLHAQRLVPGAVLGNPHYHGAVSIGEAHALKVKAIEQQAIINVSSSKGYDKEHTSILKQMCKELIEQVDAGVHCPQIND